MANFQKAYDLEERTAIFGENAIKLCGKIARDEISKPVITQFIRSATSVGANYAEANGASSKRDFRNKIFICKKEAQESRHWIRMLMACAPELNTELTLLQQESKELSMIFHKIASSVTGN